MGDRACSVEGCVKEEISVVSEGDVGFLGIVGRVGFEYSKLDDGWGVNRTAISRGYLPLSANMTEVPLVQPDSHFAPAPHALARSGCCITLNLYVSCLPSRVILLTECSVSL
jgi:hypothetical protein